MTRFLACTNGGTVSERVGDYLAARIDGDDVILALNSLPGGEDTTTDEARAGEVAADAILDRLPADARGESHQLVRGNDPANDILEFADERAVDEVVIGIRKRNPTGKVVFGSTAQQVLLNSSRPVVAVPLSA